MNQTEALNYAIDLQVDYNIKLLWLVLFTLYSIFVFWYWNRTEVEYLAQHYIKGISLVLAKVWFVALPLWLMFITRSVPIDVMLRPLLVLYGLAGILFMFYLFIYGGEKIKEFFSGEKFIRGKN